MHIHNQERVMVLRNVGWYVHTRPFSYTHVLLMHLLMRYATYMLTSVTASVLLIRFLRASQQDRRRQEEAARAGLIAGLLPFAAPEAQLKQLALPILCDLAGVPAVREQLWTHNMIPFYVSLFADQYFQVPALEVCRSFACWHTHVLHALVH